MNKDMNNFAKFSVLSVTQQAQILGGTGGGPGAPVPGGTTTSGTKTVKIESGGVTTAPSTTSTSSGDVAGTHKGVISA